MYHVVRRGGDAIHFLKEPLNVGDEVIQKINWNRRLDHMQQHSGDFLFLTIIIREGVILTYWTPFMSLYTPLPLFVEVPSLFLNFF